MRTHLGIRYFNIGRKYICFFGFFESKQFNSKKEMISAIEIKIKEDKIYEIEQKYKFIYMNSDFNFDETVQLLKLKDEEISKLG